MLRAAFSRNVARIAGVVAVPGDLTITTEQAHQIKGNHGAVDSGSDADIDSRTVSWSTGGAADGGDTRHTNQGTVAGLCIGQVRQVLGNGG